MEKIKRKRTPNFTAEEKLKFVRLLSEVGQCIVSKVTSHDATTNKEKDQAWEKITRMHNSSGFMIRTTDTLKKQWGKLKSEAKTYKAASRHSVNGTGGGPSKNFDDPVLELVVEITGRASTGITNIDDCDAVYEEDSMTENKLLTMEASTSAEYLDDTIFVDYCEEDKILRTEIEHVEVEEIVKKDLQEYTNEKENKTFKVKNKGLAAKDWANRRRPEIGASERAVKMQAQQRITNRFAAERLKAEQEKTNLIMQQIKQSAELHSLKIENEKLKKGILQALFEKVQDADPKDVAKIPTHFLFETE